ncbi:hypothetical protein [Candidatus Phycosocius spiralis]|nr:hypothetical protein [Candidatus Phycosocius spiralis]
MKRRTLVFALPFALLSACAKAKTPAASGDLGGVSTSALAPLFSAGEDVVWLRLEGCVRTSNDLAVVRPAQLYRAIALPAKGVEPVELPQLGVKIFDIWQIGSQYPKSGPSRTLVLRTKRLDPSGMWLEREFTHLGVENGVESSRLAKNQANIIAISDRYIWILSGGITPPPRLDDRQQDVFNQWRLMEEI